jgi:hypothetical protein
LFAGVHREARRIGHARELDQEAVAGRLDDTASMLRDLGVAQFTPDRLERALLISIPAQIGGHIGRKDGRQPTFGPIPADLASRGSEMRASKVS